MDSSLCVLKVIIGMFEIGVHVSALVNNCRYWPTVFMYMKSIPIVKKNR